MSGVSGGKRRTSGARRILASGKRRRRGGGKTRIAVRWRTSVSGRSGGGRTKLRCVQRGAAPFIHRISSLPRLLTLAKESSLLV
jgi:hypothetical protein